VGEWEDSHRRQRVALPFPTLTTPQSSLPMKGRDGVTLKQTPQPIERIHRLARAHAIEVEV
jgi:hypothetical protein